jgi:nicotinamidase-related amidase
MPKLSINLASTALLVMDYQMCIVETLIPDEREKVLTNIQKIIEVSRKAGIQIIYVVVQFRKGYPEISDRDDLFTTIKETGLFLESAPDTRICDEVAPRPADIVVVKRGVSAFAGSDLDLILRAKTIDTLVLTGISSLGVVESTARFARDMGYRVTVLGDCCSDKDLQANQIALETLLPRVSTVCSSKQLITAIQKSNRGGLTPMEFSYHMPKSAPP